VEKQKKLEKLQQNQRLLSRKRGLPREIILSMKVDLATLVLGNTFNQKEISHDLSNGQNMLEFKDKNAFLPNVSKYQELSINLPIQWIKIQFKCFSIC